QLRQRFVRRRTRIDWNAMRGFTAIGAVVLAGCYQPGIGDCSFKCAAAPNQCPEGLMCDGEFCRTPSHDGSCGPPPMGWTFTPLNSDPNDPYLVAGGQAWSVSTPPQHQPDSPPPGTPPPVKDDGNVRLIRIGPLSIPSNVTLAFTGLRTVILVADTAN